MASKTNPLNAVYWALRIATLLLLAGHLGVIVIGGIVALLGSQARLSMFIFPISYLGIAIGVYIGLMRFELRRLSTTIMLVLILLGDIIGLILSPQAGNPYVAIALSVVFVTITAYIEFKRHAALSETSMPSEPPAESHNDHTAP